MIARELVRVEVSSILYLFFLQVRLGKIEDQMFGSHKRYVHDIVRKVRAHEGRRGIRKQETYTFLRCLVPGMKRLIESQK